MKKTETNIIDTIKNNALLIENTEGMSKENAQKVVEKVAELMSSVENCELDEGLIDEAIALVEFELREELMHKRCDEYGYNWAASVDEDNFWENEKDGDGNIICHDWGFEDLYGDEVMYEEDEYDDFEFMEMAVSMLYQGVCIYLAEKYQKDMHYGFKNNEYVISESVPEDPLYVYHWDKKEWERDY